MNKWIAGAATALFLTVSATALAQDPGASSSNVSCDSCTPPGTQGGAAQGGSAQGGAGTVGAPGTAGAPGTEAAPPVSQAQVSEVGKGIFDSPLTMTPAVGPLGYEDGLANYTSRIAEGFNLDWNLSNAYGLMQGTGVIFGIETGFIFSHVGAPSSNFWGSSPSVPLNAGANSFLIPGEFTFGYKISDAAMASLKFGTNMLYRSDASSMRLGRSDDTKGVGQSTVDFFPSLGLNLGWALSKSVALNVRGDYIPTPAQDMFTALLGVEFPLA